MSRPALPVDRRPPLRRVEARQFRRTVGTTHRRAEMLRSAPVSLRSELPGASLRCARCPISTSALCAAAQLTCAATSPSRRGRRPVAGRGRDPRGARAERRRAPPGRPARRRRLPRPWPRTCSATAAPPAAWSARSARMMPGTRQGDRRHRRGPRLPARRRRTAPARSASSASAWAAASRSSRPAAVSTWPRRTTASCRANLEQALTGACPMVASYGGERPLILRGAGRQTRPARSTKLGVEHDVKEYPSAGHSFLNDEYHRARTACTRCQRDRQRGSATRGGRRRVAADRGVLRRAPRATESPVSLRVVGLEDVRPGCGPSSPTL